MGARGKLRTLEAGRVAFFCPGCKEHHHVTIEGPIAWRFNDDYGRPTFAPSILVRGNALVRDAQGKWTGEFQRDANGEFVEMRCHSFVRDGRIEYLSDCTHDLAGQTVDLPDLELD